MWSVAMDHRIAPNPVHASVNSYHPLDKEPQSPIMFLHDDFKLT